MKRSTASKKKVPMPRRKSLFWDVDPKKIDPDKHAKYIIERILEFGTGEELQWLFRTYPKYMLKERVENARGVLHKKTKTLWALVLR